MSLNLVKYEVKRLDIEYRDNRAGKRRLYCMPHLHRELELVCMIEGETAVSVDSSRYTLRGGDVLLTFPNQIHSYVSHGPEKYYIFIIKPDLCPDLMETFQNGVPVSPVIEGAAALPQIRQLFDLLGASCAADAVSHGYTDTLRRGYLLALLSELLSKMTVSRLSVGDSGTLRSIVAFCAENFSENLSLSLLSKKLHLNKYYISHLFSERLGLRFNDYINSLRVSEACRYLLNSDYSITEISEIVGFNTLRTFNRAFMKQMAVSPSEYRKRGGGRTVSQQSVAPSGVTSPSTAPTQEARDTAATEAYQSVYEDPCGC